jgi:hypothetical protein
MPQSDISNTLSNIRALSFLDISNSGIGAYDVPPGWTFDGSGKPWKSPAGSWQTHSPPEAKQAGLHALCAAIKDMRALTSLNISDNNLADYGRNMSGNPCEHVFGLLI